MSKVQGYSILSAEGVEELTKLVNEKLADGWKPFKQPFVFGDSVCQAMTLREKKKDKRVDLKIDRIRKTSDN